MAAKIPFNMFSMKNGRDAFKLLFGKGMPIATNDIFIAAERLGAVDVIPVGRSGGMIIRTAQGTSKIFVPTTNANYKQIYIDALERQEIRVTREDIIDVDHALPRCIALGRYEYVQVNGLSRPANRGFGPLEKEMKDREFADRVCVEASIVETSKIAETAPVGRRDILTDGIISLYNARKAGLITDQEMIRDAVNCLTNSNNNLMASALKEVDPEQVRQQLLELARG